MYPGMCDGGCPDQKQAAEGQADLRSILGVIIHHDLVLLKVAERADSVGRCPLLCQSLKACCSFCLAHRSGHKVLWLRAAAVSAALLLARLFYTNLRPDRKSGSKDALLRGPRLGSTRP